MLHSEFAHGTADDSIFHACELIVKRKLRYLPIVNPDQQLMLSVLSQLDILGITVDLTLFPLDTIKTRLQASANTKFSLDLLKGVYDGVGPGLLASAPACAAFFGAYDSFKRSLTARFPDPKLAPIVNMLAAAGGDLTQSVVRVPFE
eukprot:evm.model.NODE_51229_length_18078_cov_23.847383.4